MHERLLVNLKIVHLLFVFTIIQLNKSSKILYLPTNLIEKIRFPKSGINENHLFYTTSHTQLFNLIGNNLIIFN